MIHIIIKSPVSGKQLGVIMLSRMCGGEPADHGGAFRFWRPQRTTSAFVWLFVVLCRRLRVLLVPSQEMASSGLSCLFPVTALKAPPDDDGGDVTLL